MPAVQHGRNLFEQEVVEVAHLGETLAATARSYGVTRRRRPGRRCRHASWQVLQGNADELCDRVAFVVDGEIVAMNTPTELKIARRQRVVRVEYRGIPSGR